MFYRILLLRVEVRGVKGYGEWVYGELKLYKCFFLYFKFVFGIWLFLDFNYNRF